MKIPVSVRNFEQDRITDHIKALIKTLEEIDFPPNNRHDEWFAVFWAENGNTDEMVPIDQLTIHFCSGVSQMIKLGPFMDIDGAERLRYRVIEAYTKFWQKKFDQLKAEADLFAKRLDHFSAPVAF